MSAVATKPVEGPSPAGTSRFLRLLNSTVGLKLVMAVTGVMLTGFVLVHMAGNLQVFQGAESLDAYGRLLHKEPAVLWTARATLLGAVGLHIYAFLGLAAHNRKAGGVRSGPRSAGSRASPRGRCG